MTETRSINPYQYLNAVDPEMFFGRTIFIRRVYEAISRKQCISFVGTRHIGKSSLLKYICSPEVQNESPYDVQHVIFVFLDLRDYRQKSVDLFFDSISDHIIDSCFHLQLPRSSRRGTDRFSEVLLQIADHNFFPVLLMDAFDHIVHNEQFDLNFLSFLRAKTPWVSYITASIEPLQDICHQGVRESPFFNIFNRQELGPLAHNEALALATIPVQKTSCSFSSTEVAWVLSMAGRHPFFIQRVCHWLFEEKRVGEDVVTLDMLEDVVYRDLYQHFKILWSDISEEKRGFLQEQARKLEPSSKDLPELGESALFRRFIREQHAAPAYELAEDLTVEEFEKILSNLDDLHWLGQSKLRHLKSVSSQLNHTSHLLSTIEVGREIRKFLEKAFESTRGSGNERVDEAPDWQAYNILYYRYFGRHHKMTHHQIASRLFISSRTYFRERSKTISILYNKLLEMESAYKTQEV